MSEVRHDSAWWINSQSLQTLLVVFCNGEKYSKDTSLLPLIAREVFEFNNKSLQTLLVVFCNGEKYSKDSSLLPIIAKEVYDFNKRYTVED